MFFDKKSFLESMSIFKYGKEGLTEDILYILGKLKMVRNYSILDDNDLDLDVYGDDIYKKDDNYIYFKKKMTLLSIFLIPFNLLSVGTMRTFILFIMLVVAPFVAANNIVFGK